MEKAIIVVNTGSASKKYAIYRKQSVAEVTFRYEHVGETFLLTTTANGVFKEQTVSDDEYKNAFSHILIKVQELGITINPESITIGLRVVAPGTFFTKHRIVNDEYLKMLETAERIAPLHIKPVIEELSQITNSLPGVTIVAVSDSAFHSTMPDKARLYGLSAKDTSDYDIYRFGYHGLSTSMALKSLDEVPPRVIVCHLGGGSSVTAVKDGVSVDTSMGFTPLEGIIGGSRIGDIDAGAVVHLEKQSSRQDSLLEYLNTQCGLKGIGGNGDIRNLIELEKSGDKNAHNALELYVYQIQKHIGAYTAILGGLDVLVFTGTVGERSFILRERICSALGSIGVAIDINRNSTTIEEFGEIGIDQSNTTRIVIIPSREMDMIALTVSEFTK